MNAEQAQRARVLEDAYHVDDAGWWIDDNGTWLGSTAGAEHWSISTGGREHWEIIIADEEGSPKWEVNGWPPPRAVVVATLAKLGLPNTWSDNEMGWLDVGKILAYDAERIAASPKDSGWSGRERGKFGEEMESNIAYCLQSIADKPHRAPLYLRDLVHQAIRMERGTD